MAPPMRHSNAWCLEAWRSPSAGGRQENLPPALSRRDSLFQPGSSAAKYTRRNRPLSKGGRGLGPTRCCAVSCAEHIRRATRLGVLDIHTGPGPCGYGDDLPPMIRPRVSSGPAAGNGPEPDPDHANTVESPTAKVSGQKGAGLKPSVWGALLLPHRVRAWWRL